MIAQISKVNVRETLKGQWSVILNLKLMDGATELFNQDFSEDYKTGDNIANIEMKFKVKMKEIINRYKSEQAIFTNPKLDTVVTALQNQLEV